MNAIDYRATRRETSHLLKAAAWLRRHRNATLCIMGIVALMCAVGGMEYTDAIKMEALR